MNDEPVKIRIDEGGTPLRCYLFLIAVLVIGGVAMWLLPPLEFEAMPPNQAEEVQTLPSPSELQEWVNEVLSKAGKPPIKVDGILGSEFREGYEAAFCYQQGVYHCKKAGM
ncbi:MAG: hypothetical protein PHH26_00600 [Candidatus Thermoplasmatota archaeon]|nr:hypothetical protein [Candidatus Thermoplasmatota archaeon]